MSGTGRRKRSSSSSEEILDDPSSSSIHHTDVSSSTSSERPTTRKRSKKHISSPSASSATASDSQTSLPSSSTHSHTIHEQSTPTPSQKKEKGRANGKRQKKPAIVPHDNFILPASTPSSGFSSAMSDTSVHSATSGTSSPYASGSVFHRLNANDIKYRDEKAKVLRSYIVGSLLGEGMYLILVISISMKRAQSRKHEQTKMLYL
jgi:cytoskeletal protein RodZ